MNQDYERYTDADHRMWQQLFERQMQQLPRIASQAYLDGIAKVGFVPDHIPHFLCRECAAIGALFPECIRVSAAGDGRAGNWSH